MTDDEKTICKALETISNAMGMGFDPCHAHIVVRSNLHAPTFNAVLRVTVARVQSVARMQSVDDVEQEFWAMSVVMLPDGSASLALGYTGVLDATFAKALADVHKRAIAFINDKAHLELERGKARAHAIAGVAAALRVGFGHKE